jgi:hypothetical protein
MHQQLAQYLGLSAEDLDARLPGLRWIKEDTFHAVHDEDGDGNVPVRLRRNEQPVEVLPAGWFGYHADKSEQAAAARKLHRLMIEYAPRRLKELLLDRAAPVVIGTARFHLPVENPGADRTRARLCDGSWLELERSGPNVAYVPVASAGRAAAQSAAPAIPADEADTDSDIDWDAFVHLDQLGPAREETRRDAEPGKGRGKRRASRSPEGEEQPQRVRLPMSAPGKQRWEALRAARVDRVRSFDELSDREQLLLNVAASCVMPCSEWEGLRQSDKARSRLRDAIRSRREQEFSRMANLIAQVGVVRHTTVRRLNKRLKKLDNEAHRALAWNQLIKDRGGVPLPENEDMKIDEDTAVCRFHANMRFLEALAKKAQDTDMSEAEWLKSRILNPELEELAPEQRAAANPYSKQSRLARLKEVLGLAFSSSVPITRIIKALTGVDMDADDASAEKSAAPAVPNPFPRDSPRGVTIRGLFDELARLDNETINANLVIFSHFFQNRASLGAPDPAKSPNQYAHAVAAALRLVGHLGVEDHDGNPREPVLLEDWLRKEVFAAALRREMSSLDDVKKLALSNDDKQKLRKQIQALTKAKCNSLYPLIEHMTGLKLGRR